MAKKPFEEMSMATREAAARAAEMIGCQGAHQRDDGSWAPCPSEEAFRVLYTRGARAYRQFMGEEKGVRVVFSEDGRVEKPLPPERAGMKASDPSSTYLPKKVNRGRRRQPKPKDAPMNITGNRRQRVQGLVGIDAVPGKKRVHLDRTLVKHIVIDPETKLP